MPESVKHFSANAGEDASAMRENGVTGTRLLPCYQGDDNIITRGMGTKLDLRQAFPCRKLIPAKQTAKQPCRNKS